jgi:hypothetical protein
MKAFFETSITRVHTLIGAGALVMIGVILLGNLAVFPLALSDFLFFSVLFFLLALSRSSFAFLLFVMLVPIEIVNVAPVEFLIALRPYQWAGALLAVAFAIRLMAGRVPVKLPVWRLSDTFLLVMLGSGVWAAMGSVSFSGNMKQVLVLASFGLLYGLTRIFVRSFADLRRVAVGSAVGSMVVGGYALWQQFRFMQGDKEAFEVMAGRPNSVFAEPDWLGGFAVIVCAMVAAFGLRIFAHNSWQVKRQGSFLWSSGLLFTLIILLLTVARSAWFGAGVVLLGAVILMLIQGVSVRKPKSWHWNRASFFGLSVVLLFGLSWGIISLTRLTSFSLLQRGASATSGEQLITVACDYKVSLPQVIESVDELAPFACHHINLEDIAWEQSRGEHIQSVLRKDPSISVRATIYATTKQLVADHWMRGIGFASIGEVLGQDTRGVGLNASNIFIEVWLGTGLIGLLSFVLVWISVGVQSFKRWRDESFGNNADIFAFLGLSWLGLSAFNTFNAGIFLGFMWVWIALAVTFKSK